MTAMVLVLVPMAFLTVACLRFGLHIFGPAFPRYVAVDNDARLTEMARTAKPLIDAMRRYHEIHGNYPENITAVREFLPSSNVAPQRDDMADGWMYFPTTDPPGFTLSKSLGWDPTLNYQWNGTSEIWIYDPGDGSDEKQISLNP